MPGHVVKILPHGRIIEVPEGTHLLAGLIEHSIFLHSFASKDVASAASAAFGIAVDLGTTTIALDLCNMTRGTVSSSLSTWQRILIFTRYLLKNFASPNVLLDAEAKVRNFSNQCTIDDPCLLKYFLLSKMNFHGNICQLTGKGAANGPKNGNVLTLIAKYVEENTEIPYLVRKERNCLLSASH